MSFILVVENNEDFAYTIKWHFEEKGYKVISVSTGNEAIDVFNDNLVDIVLLDINLDGDIDGKEVARFIRNKNSVVPIIFMSGQNKTPIDVVEGIEIGADFFLKKPLSILEIDVYVKKALESIQKNKKVFQLGNCLYLSNERIIEFGNRREILSDKENKVFLMLAMNYSKTVLLNDILYSIWGDTLMEESLRNIISSLRKKINSENLIIETIKHKGYRLSLL